MKSLRDFIIKGGAYDITKSTETAERDLEQIIMKITEGGIDKINYTTYSELKKILGLAAENRITHTLDFFAVASYWTAYLQKVPLIKVTKLGEKIVEWIPIDEARKMTELYVAQEYFDDDFEDRIPSDYIDKEIHIETSEFIKKVLENEKKRVPNG